jgi:hypothetical protein
LIYKDNLPVVGCYVGGSQPDVYPTKEGEE